MSAKVENSGWLRVTEYRKYLGVFGLDEESSLEDMKKIYRALVVKWHPDQFQNNDSKRVWAEEKLKGINLAYNKLKMLKFGESSPPSSGNFSWDSEPKTRTGSCQRKLSRLKVNVELRQSS